MGNGFAAIGRPATAVVSLAGLFVGAAIAIACVGDSEVQVPMAATPSVGAEGGVSEAGGEPTTCPPRDLTPGGCQVNEDYCAPPGGAPRCIGKNEACPSTAVMRCLGSTSCAGRPCCYNGPIVPGKVCAKAGLQNDTECTPVPEAGAAPCGDKDHLTCLNDGDCQTFSAGKCVTMLIGASKRSIGICDGT